MGRTSGITWTDATFNPWIGCTKVSAGCTNCYAENLADNRHHWSKWGKGNPRKRTSASNWHQPIKWNKEAEKEGKRIKVFCASLADVFDTEVLDVWRDDLFELIYRTPNLDWMLLTKRPEKMREWMEKREIKPNIWCGVSVEDQKTADGRLPILLEVNAAVRWVSYEPALAPIDFGRFMFSAEGNAALARPMLDWIIVGGESEQSIKAREFNLSWCRDLLKQREGSGTRIFVKQLGERPIEDGEAFAWHLPTCEACQDQTPHWHKGSNKDPAEWPEDLRVQEFPMSAMTGNTKG